MRASIRNTSRGNSLQIHTVTRGVIKNGVILVQDGRILKVGADVAVPEGATVIDAKGKFIAPGFVTDTKLEGDSRYVTFANGFTVRELLVSCDDNARRLAYSVQGGSAQHHHASFEAKPNGRGGTCLVWTTDVFPDAAAAKLRPMIEQGTEVMRRTLGRSQLRRSGT